MRQFIAIAFNAFMELVRQPVYLMVMTCSAGFIIFLSVVPYFGLGDDAKLVKDTALAVMLVSGLLGAVLCASTSLAQEIRLGTALTVLSKPVSRFSFLMGKYAGLAGTLTLLSASNLVATLLASRMAYDAYGDADMKSLSIFVGAAAAAYAISGFLNYFMGRTFVSTAVFSFVVATTLAFLYIAFYTRLDKAFGEVASVDWRLVPAGILILFALLILAALALACSTRLDIVPTLVVCCAIFLLGLVSDYLFKAHADAGSLWAKTAYAVTPNWQQFWLADALEEKKRIPWVYVEHAAIYLVVYLGAALSVAALLFEDRELT
jgi:ABC-type transport system involved in multi-copper enzyme maturation permease subunit